MPQKAKLATRSNTTANSTENLAKGSKLTFAEMDGNFVGLRDQTFGVVADDSATIDIAAGDTLYIQGGSNVTTSTDSAGVLTINATGEVTADSTTTFTNKTFDANATGNSITNLEVADLASGVLDTDLSSVSGSDDTLASAKAIKAYVDANQGTGDLTFVGSTISAPSNADLTLTVAGTGQIVVDGTLTATEVISDLTGTIEFDAKATEAISKGEAIYIAGIDGNTPTVALARANAAGTMPAFGIAAADIALNATGKITTFGSLTGLDVTDFGETSITFALGDTVYVSSAEAGKLTNVAPTGESNLIQNIGKIERHTPTNNITIKVGGAGRSNATPALDEGNIFIGNSSNASSTVALADQIKNYKAITLTGDDSTGTDIDIGETFKIAGTQNVSTAVSGDTLTVTGPDLSSYITASSTDTLTNKTFDANGTGNSISNIEVADFAAAAIVTAAEGIGSNNNDTTIPTSAAVKAYADSVGGGATLGDLTAIGSTLLSPSNGDLTLASSGTGLVIMTASDNYSALSNGPQNVMYYSDQSYSPGTRSFANRIHSDYKIDSGAADSSSSNDRQRNTMSMDLDMNGKDMTATSSFMTRGANNTIETNVSNSASGNSTLGNALAAQGFLQFNTTGSGNLDITECAGFSTSIEGSVASGTTLTIPDSYGFHSSGVSIGGSGTKTMTNFAHFYAQANSTSVTNEYGFRTSSDALINDIGGVTLQNSNITTDAISITENKVTTTRSNDDLVLEPSGTGRVRIGNILIRQDQNQIKTVGTGTLTIQTENNTGNVSISGAQISMIAPTLSFHSSDAGLGLVFEDNTITTDASNQDIEFDPNGTGSVSSFAELNMNSNKIVNVTDPTSAQDAATKAYVDANTPETGDITFVGSTIISPSNADLTLNPAGTGKVNINAVYTLPNTDGSADQVLGTNGSGTLSFVDPVSTNNVDGGTATSVYDASLTTIDGGTA